METKAYVHELIKRAYAIYPTRKGLPKLSFDINGFCLYGEANIKTNSIRLNSKFDAGLNEDDMRLLTSVTLHEYTHLLDPKANHGKEFKKWAARLEAKFHEPIETHVVSARYPNSEILKLGKQERTDRKEKRKSNATYYIYAPKHQKLFAKTRKPRSTSWWYKGEFGKEECKVISAKEAQQQGLLETCKVF